MKNSEFIYVTYNENIQGLVKIGFTTRQPSIRLSELSSSTSVPGQFKLLCSFNVINGRHAEKIIFSQLSNYRIKGSEFFEISLNEIEKKIEDILESRNQLLDGEYSQYSILIEMSYMFLKATTEEAYYIHQSIYDKNYKLKSKIWSEIKKNIKENPKISTDLIPSNDIIDNQLLLISEMNISKIENSLYKIIPHGIGSYLEENYPPSYCEKYFTKINNSFILIDISSFIVFLFITGFFREIEYKSGIDELYTFVLKKHKIFENIDNYTISHTASSSTKRELIKEYIKKTLNNINNIKTIQPQELYFFKTQNVEYGELLRNLEFNLIKKQKIKKLSVNDILECLNLKINHYFCESKEHGTIDLQGFNEKNRHHFGNINYNKDIIEVYIGGKEILYLFDEIYEKRLYCVVRNKTSGTGEEISYRPKIKGTKLIILVTSITK